ncbi:hypothetical protein DYB30_009589 [Aphanomyces astaci]|uniref:Phosphoribosyltransferase domain-containing protein n=1 Tax=Aphanomyces astaci TaxID=112090 RepID=A0A397EK60_APHAT|nr:hypothetical protein DYB30_009589 [Aphanomyces astaci]RHY80791.1 hypothetical protein DYB31_008532 [Aphanomyces astaci]
MLRKSTVQFGAVAAAAAGMVASQSSPNGPARCDKIYESGYVHPGLIFGAIYIGLTCSQVLGRGVKLELWKAKVGRHKNVDVLDLESETIQTGLTRVRDFNATGAKFVHVANKLLRNVLESALTQLPNDEDTVVTTPLGHKVKGVDYEEGVTVCGLALVERSLVSEQLQLLLKTTLPFDSAIGQLQLSPPGDSPGALAAVDLPDGIEDMHVILLHPEFASFDVIQPAIQVKWTLTAAFDAASDSQHRIVPGLGNFEKRYVGDDSGVVPDAAAGDDDETSAGWSSWWPFK